MDVIIDESGLGQRLQEARRTAGLTQQSLCQLANISYSTLAKIERGAIKAPSIFTIQSLTDALGISLDALMGKPAQDAVISSDKKSVSKNGICISRARKIRKVSYLMTSLNWTFLKRFLLR